jgi:hypothetical protein
LNSIIYEIGKSKKKFWKVNKKALRTHTNTELNKQEGLLMAKNYSNTNNSNKNAKNSSSSYGNTQSKNKNSNKNTSNSYSNTSDSRNCGRDADAYDESDRY